MIDDDLITTKCLELQTKIQAMNKQTRILIAIDHRLTEVKSKLDMQGVNTKAEAKKIVPIDNQTGEAYTTARRQEVYDKAMKDADAALI